MKKFFNSLTFIFKAFLLVVILFFGWAFINISNLIKGKKLSKNDSLSSDRFGTDKAMADVPTTCPHVAYFDGREFQIENNFLLGKPQSFFSDYAAVRALHKNKLISPDLLKFSSTPLPYNGRLTLKLHEIEDKEETFVSWLKLIRVFHPENSEVFIDSNFNKFYVVDKNEAKKSTLLPLQANLNSSKDITERFNKKELLWEDHSRDPKDTYFKKSDSIEFAFHLPTGNENPYLVFKSMFRGPLTEAAPVENKFVLSWLKFVNEPVAARALTLLFAALYLVFQNKSFVDSLVFAPFIFGSSQAPSCSIHFSYLNKAGNKYCRFLIHEPRDWRYGTEVISLPKEAIGESGSVKVKAEFTQRHKLNFMGILPNIKEHEFRQETLPVTKAIHSRSGDITKAFHEESQDYAHMISGDEISVEFKAPETTVGENEKETYILQSSGFYTGLRDEFKALAQNWQERTSSESKRYVAEMAELRK